MRKNSRSIFILPLIFLSVLFWKANVSAREGLEPFRLENGLKVILVENRSAPVLALQVWVRVGSADEADHEAGMSHFIEHMLFKGTEKEKDRMMAKKVESVGGTMNAYTSYDQTVYHIVLPSRYEDMGIDLLSDAIQNPAFDPLEMEREREVILEEIRRGQDDPSRRLFQQTAATLYEKHPYGRPIIGYEKTIKAITREEMVSFYRKWYTPDRLTLIAVGDLDPRSMERRIRGSFREMKASSDKTSSRVQEPQPSGVRTRLSFGNFKETYLQIAFPISSVRDKDSATLDVLSQVLGGGETSRLVQKVKLEKRLVHSISASSFTPKNPGLFVIGTTLSAENMKAALGSIFQEIERMKEEGVTAEELHRVKIHMESDLIYDRQTVQGVAKKIGYYEVVAGDIDFERAYLQRITLLQEEDLRKVMQKYFGIENAVISVLAPEEKSELLKGLPLKTMVEGYGASLSPTEKKGPPVARRVLDNGVRLVVKENRSVPIVSIQVSFLGGVRYEVEAQNGINQFLAVMITKGTAHQSSLQIAKKVERFAGSLSGFSGYNSFGLTFTFLGQHFEEAFELLSEVIKEPAFDQEEMEKRRGPILASIRQQEDNLGQLVFKQFRKTLYERHPYRMDPLGTIESVQKLTQQDLRDYYAKMAVPENMVLAVVGDVDPRQVFLAAQKAFGNLKKGSFSPVSIVEEPTLKKVRRSEIFRAKEQAHFVLGFLGTDFLSKDRYALEVLDAALSGHGGRLFRELRDKESLAYALDFFAYPNLDRGFVGAYMGTRPDKLERAIEGVLRELKKVREEGLTEEEVDRARTYLIGNFEINLQTNGAQAGQMALDELYGLGFDHYQRYAEEIRKVSREEVHRVAKEYFDFEAMALAIIKPPPEKKE